VSALYATAGFAQGQEGSSATQLAQANPAETLHITVARAILAQSASQAALRVQVGPTAALPKNSFVRVRGLPPMVSLSEGYATAPGAWAVALNALASLQMIVPAGVTGRAELSISLVNEDGSQLADAEVVLTIQASQPAPAQEKEAQPPPPAQVPAPPHAPMLSPADREAAERFIARGEQEIGKGQVAIARQFFLRAAQGGLARGALLLAATYDPRELARWGVQGVLPNLPEARKWYERARELGAPEAEERLARLGTG
jgi:TPR repeat protein